MISKDSYLQVRGLHLQGNMQQPETIRRRIRHPSSPNIDLQRLVNQSRLRQRLIPFRPPLDELFLARVVSNVLVPILLLLNRDVRQRLSWASLLVCRRVVVSSL